MIYGYARVSSIGQAKDGNSLEAQENTLIENGCQVVYKEAFTGTTTERPEFSKLLSVLQKGDTLMVTKLDRFSRTAVEGASRIKELNERGIIIWILNMGRVDDTPMGRLMVTMLLGFAEFEHDQILERLTVGKAVAKSHGKKTDGRNKAVVDETELKKFLKKQKDGSMTVIECCKELKISRTTWYNLVKELESKEETA